MNTLRATPDTRRALDRRKLESRLIAVQGRAEALPQLNLGGLLAGASNRLQLFQFQAAADLLDDVDDRIARHMAVLEESEMAAAGQAQDQLLADRGVETVVEGVAKTRDGWRWLTSRNPRRLSSDQISTGNRYCALYLAANRDTLSTVSANDNALAPEPRNAVDELAKARSNLARVQRHISDATGSERLVGLLDSVCGRGETLRSLAGGDDRKAGAYEVELRLALDMAGVAFKGKREEG
jgi:hypothetical protein